MNLGKWAHALFVWSQLFSAFGMFSKKPLPEDSLGAPALQRLRANLGDLFLSNTISGARAHTVFEDCDDAGIPGFRKLAKTGKRGGLKNNIPRDLRRLLSKNKAWPKPYFCRCRVWSTKLQREVWTTIPIMLPHELLAALLKYSTLESLLDLSGLGDATAKNLATLKAALGEELLIPLGIWGDGCPANWDRTESIEVWSLNFPGIAAWSNLRLPLSLISKKFVSSVNTFDDIFTVLSWSMRHCALGVWPNCRHNGEPFGHTDPNRAKASGKPFGFKAAVVEIRGDWMLFKEVFRLPGWNTLAGCCWRCSATPSDIRNASAAAPWRAQRLSHWDLLVRMASLGNGLSPVFSFPGFLCSFFQMDWLHVVDIGIALDFLGNLFWLLLDKYPGATKKEKCSELWKDIQEYYSQVEPGSRLDNLKLSMIKQTGKAPKLRARAGEARGLIAFAAEAARTKLSDQSPTEHTAKMCAQHLLACYNCLSKAQFDHEVMKTNSRCFCLLYIALERTAANNKLWRVKPKLHLFQELCEESGRLCPSDIWGYRDEDFGGSIALLSRRRGGSNTPGSTGLATLQRFYAKHKPPSL